MKSLRAALLLLAWFSIANRSGYAYRAFLGEELVVESDNGLYELRIVPSDPLGQEGLERKVRGIVYLKQGHWRLKLWETTLSNRLSPEDAVISDDGDYFVTVDNWMRGSGPDILAFYSKEGQIQRYGLGRVLLAIADTDYLVQLLNQDRLRETTAEELTRKLQEDKGADWLFSQAAMFGRGGPFWHHVELGLSWRGDHMMFIESHGQARTFCAWFKWTDRWTAWDAKTGHQIRTTEELTQRWNARARQKALAAVKTGEHPANEAEFLEWLRIPGDRATIEELLGRPAFDNGWRSGEGAAAAEFGGYSMARQLGDRVLCRWDRLPEPGRDACHFLGTVEGIVKVRHAQKEGRGWLWVYLLPADKDAPAKAVEQASCQRALHTDSRLAGGGFEARFTIRTATPGRYRIAAVWDLAETETIDWEQPLPTPGKGDVTGEGAEPFTVKAGATTQVGLLECSTVHAD